ncbi:lytic transglycosylase domain-containing protein [Oxalobacteraceae bacterium R-40]|uniref:Lytic transglycosylase domain-containing protein n=1 Tax=Keguizhuia sedimenti TaxID=3064264 RepID=A0ABU1BN57_9BURK|nr:lytic transglycosylase domain-containing protein [Oxalobacteraceae bacterium R-40]
MRLRASFAWLCAAPLLMLAAANARADVYGYIDKDGTAHFSAEKLDSRYRLFMRGNQAFDSADVMSGLDANSKTTVKPAILRYLEQHPNLKKYEALVRQAATEFSLDPALLKAVMAAESGFNPMAVSPKGAIGLMQIMPATAERYGVQGDDKKTLMEKLTDPKTNIRLGARYLRDLMKMFPDEQHLVLASYNAGEGAVQRYRNSVPPYPETRDYVQVVSQFYRLYKPSGDKGTKLASNESKGSKRIYMTIPGRRNVPEPLTTMSQ